MKIKLKILKAMALAASKDPFRARLGGVWIDKSKSGTPVLMATDGKIIHALNLIADGSDFSEPVIIPLAYIKLLSRTEVDILIVEHGLKIDEAVFPVINASAPNWKNLFEMKGYAKGIHPDAAFNPRLLSKLLRFPEIIGAEASQLFHGGEGTALAVRYFGPMFNGVSMLMPLREATIPMVPDWI